MNLADVLRARRLETEAESVLRGTLRRAPESAELHHSRARAPPRVGYRGHLEALAAWHLERGHPDAAARYRDALYRLMDVARSPGSQPAAPLASTRHR